MAETIEVLQPGLAHRGPGGAARPPHGRPHRLPDPRPPAGSLRTDGVNVLDVLLVGGGVAAVVGGYRLGFTTRVLSWVGSGRRAWSSASGCCPGSLERIDPADHVRGRAASTVGVVVVFAALGQAVGLWARQPPHAPTCGRGARSPTDRVLGAVAGLVGLVALAWVILPGARRTRPGWPAQLATGSALAPAVDDHLPAPPDVSQALRSLVGSDNYPQVFDALQPTPDGRRAAARRAGLDRRRGRGRGPIGRQGRGRRPATASRTAPAGSWPTTWSSPTPTWWRARARPRSSATTAAASRPTVVAFDPARDLALLQVDGARPAGPAGGGRASRARPAACSATPVASRCASRRSRWPARSRPPAATSTTQRVDPPPGARAGRRPAAGRLGLGARRRRRARWSASPSPSRPTSPASPTPWRPPSSRRCSPRRTRPRSSTGPCIA